MKLQIREYIGFIKEFTENTNIMTKSFFVVTSYQPPMIDTSKGVLSGVGNIFNKKDDGAKTTSERFAENKSQLDQRTSVVQQGLVRTGVRAIRLGTEELVELFFKMFNPGELEKPTNLIK